MTIANFVQLPSVPFVPQPICHSCGRKPEQMDRKMRIDMPWPMPFSVINSAIHMIRPVPPVITMIMTTMFQMEASGITLLHW